MTFEDIDKRLDQFDERLQNELQRVFACNLDQIACEYEPVDCDPPPVVF